MDSLDRIYDQALKRASQTSKELLPIQHLENKALYIRLAAYAIIGSTNKEDYELLLKLTGHNYGLIARTAAIRFVHLFGEGSLKKLGTKVDDGIQKVQSKSLADAIRSAEIEFFGVANLW